MDAVLARLAVETYIAKYYATGPLGGEIGPVYNIGGIDGTPIQAATEHAATGIERRTYEDAKAQWRAMSDRYSEENPSAVKMQYFY